MNTMVPKLLNLKMKLFGLLHDPGHDQGDVGSKRRIYFERIIMIKLPLIITDLKFLPRHPDLHTFIVNQFFEWRKDPLCTDNINASFILRDNEFNDLKTLYDLTLAKIKTLYPPYVLKPTNSSACWAYVSNKDSNTSLIHHHIRTATINAVFYLSPSTLEKYNDGAIGIYSNKTPDSEVFVYKPRQNDLIIMPSWLLHRPLPTAGERHRVAINMEIQCSYDSNTKIIDK